LEAEVILFEDFLWPDGDAPDFSSMLDRFYFADGMSSITEEKSTRRAVQLHEVHALEQEPVDLAPRVLRVHTARLEKPPTEGVRAVVRLAGY